jgi:hypothetical protein
MAYQRVQVSFIIDDEDVESAKRELHNTLEAIAEESKLHHEEVISEYCDDPETEDLYEYEDAA